MIRETALHWSTKKAHDDCSDIRKKKAPKKRDRLWSRGRKTKKSRNGLGSGQ